MHGTHTGWTDRERDREKICNFMNDDNNEAD